MHEREMFWMPAELEELEAMPTGCHREPFVFLAAQLPIDLDTGRVVRRLWDLPEEAVAKLATGWEHVDCREGPIKAQTWQIYKNLERILGMRGSSLDRIIRQRILLTDVVDARSVEEVVDLILPTDKPATTISGMGRRGVRDDVGIQIEVVALTNESDVPREVVYVPGLERVTSPYPQAVKVGQFVFFSGIMGVDPQTGHVPTRYTDVSSATLRDDLRRFFDQSGHHSLVSSEPWQLQYALLHQHMLQVMEHLGSNIQNVLHENFLATIAMKEFGAHYPLRFAVFETKEGCPTGALLNVPMITGDPDAVVVCDAVGIVPGEHMKSTTDRPDLMMGFAPMTTSAGPLTFHTGYVAMNKEQHTPITSLAGREDRGKHVASGRLDGSESTLAQAWHVYATIERAMGDAGTDLSAAVHQLVYLKDIRNLSLVNDVARSFFNGSAPPTTAIAVDEIGPYPELELEIDITCLS